MIRILQSSWTASLAGLIAFLATMVAVWLPHAHPPANPIGELPSQTAEPSWKFSNPEVDLLIAELKSQKETLATKEKELNELATRLESERSELVQLTQTVQQAQAEFDQNVSHVREQETANLKRLAKMYATMSPEGAAAVFKALDDGTLVKVLTFMKETEIGPVLEVLARQSTADAKRVADISERLRLALQDGKKSPAQ